MRTAVAPTHGWMCGGLPYIITFAGSAFLAEDAGVEHQGCAWPLHADPTGANQWHTALSGPQPSVRRRGHVAEAVAAVDAEETDAVTKFTKVCSELLPKVEEDLNTYLSKVPALHANIVAALGAVLAIAGKSVDAADGQPTWDAIKAAFAAVIIHHTIIFYESELHQSFMFTHQIEILLRNV